MSDILYVQCLGLKELGFCTSYKIFISLKSLYLFHKLLLYSHVKYILANVVINKDWS